MITFLSKKRVSFIIIILFFVLIGCTGPNTGANRLNNEAIYYGLIYTSNMKNSSKIVLMSKDGNVIKEIKLNSGGLKKHFKKDNKIYIPVTGVPWFVNNKVLELDLTTLKIRYFKANELPIESKVDSDFLYVLHNTAADHGTLTKIDLVKGNIIKEITVPGVVTKLNKLGERIIVMTDHPQEEIEKQSINIFDTDLVLQEKAQHYYSTFSTDVIQKNDNEILILNQGGKDGNRAKSFLIYNLSTKDFTPVPLSEFAPHQVMELLDNFIMTHYNFTLHKGNSISIYNKVSGNTTVIQLQNTLYRNVFQNDILYSSDTNAIFVYDAKNNFRLIERHEIPQINEMVLSDFFVVNNDQNF